MKKRMLAAVAAVMMVAASLAGCGGSNSQGGAPAENAASTDAAAPEETEARKVIIATAGSGEPYSLIHDDGSWTGIDAEIWEEISNRTGWTIELKQAAFDAIWGELDTARADVCANCWAVKPERVDKYNASIPYYGDAQCVIVPESNDDINAFADLQGKVVGCTNGQAAQTIIEDMAQEIGFEVKLYEDSSVGMNDLKLERIDAYANTTTNVNNFTHYNEDAKFRFLDEDLMANNVAYFFPKTEEGEALCAEVNAVLEELLADGTIAAITEKWMFADMTKLIQ